MRLELVLDAGGRVQQAWFEGGGCLISQAAASILCRAVEGKTIGELRQLTAQQMLDWLETPLTPRRMQCGLLAFKLHWVSPGRMREGMRLVAFAPKGGIPVSRAAENRMPRRLLRAALLKGYREAVLFSAGFPIRGKMLH